MGAHSMKANKLVSASSNKIVNPPELSEMVSPLDSLGLFIQKKNIQSVYSFEEVLGSGYFGNVRMGVRLDTQYPDKYAIKSIPKAKVEHKIHLLQRELQTLSMADHPNIIRLYEVYEDELYIHLVMELCTGGELFDRILERQHWPEKEACAMVYKLLHAINHLNSLNISHRDIKAENILFTSTDPSSEIKLIDFGLAVKYADDSYMHSMVGTPYYVAPEVLNNKYGPECDVWSIGVIMYFLLAGTPPFYGHTRNDIYRKVIIGEFSFKDPIWQTISEEAKDLIRLMLCKSRKARITPPAALEHSWFKSHMYTQSTKHETKVLNRLARFKKNSAFRQEVLNLVSRHLKRNEISELNHIFRCLDVNHTGYVSLEDLQGALTRLDLNPDNLVAAFSGLGSGDEDQICYSDFIIAAMDRRILLDQEVRWLAFKYFDGNNDGKITLENIKNAMAKLDMVVTDEQVAEMLKEAGLKYDNYIEFPEFCKILEPLPDELSSVNSAGCS